jgi:hypothetical protein
MSEKKVVRPYLKKFSSNSDSTSFNSSSSSANKVILVQNIASKRLSDHLYSYKEVEIKLPDLPFFGSSPNVGGNPPFPPTALSAKEDPFLKAKM